MQQPNNKHWSVFLEERDMDRGEKHSEWPWSVPQSSCLPITGHCGNWEAITREYLVFVSKWMTLKACVWLDLAQSSNRGLGERAQLRHEGEEGGAGVEGLGVLSLMLACWSVFGRGCGVAPRQLEAACASLALPPAGNLPPTEQNNNKKVKYEDVCKVGATLKRRPSPWWKRERKKEKSPDYFFYVHRYQAGVAEGSIALIILSSGVTAERCPLGPKAGTRFSDVT